MDKKNTMQNVLPEMPRRIPREGTFELTVRCNLHCKMCMFRHDDRENPELTAKELTAEQWIDLARQAAEAGTLQLLITGGEPMLRPDFCEIWEGIYKIGFVMELYTNATLVTPKIMETLQKYPPHMIGVTIYGASPETYDRVCGNSKAFLQMLNGTRQLMTLPSEMRFRSTLIRDSYADGDLIDRLVKSEFGESYSVMQACPINKAVRGGCAEVESCRIPPELDMQMKAKRVRETVRQIVGDRFDPKNLRIVRKNNSIMSEDEQKTRLTLFGCQAGMSQYTITYEGKLLACQMIGVFYTDALQEGVQNAWERYPYEVHIPYGKGKCGSCEYIDTCQSCYGSRYAETGDFNGCSDYIYRTAKAKKQYESFWGGMDNEKCKL
ncbi:MAG: radical SAM protein [Lachnospiraceae bacterium]|nr:radical SAM protein [Lachnospiraceae bacterium]